jgi:hypothetical protein
VENAEKNQPAGMFSTSRLEKRRVVMKPYASLLQVCATFQRFSPEYETLYGLEDKVLRNFTLISMKLFFRKSNAQIVKSIGLSLSFH